MQEVKLNGQSIDIVKENVEKLKKIFPEIVTEDKIDFDKLKAVLGEYVEKDDESYRFTWHGKRDALRESQIPSTGTLRPCIEDSKNWDTTQNLYIEGDNLEVLKLLQKSYDNKVKMIYIDPPYNKDKDFIYPDKWSDPIKEYQKITGQLDDDDKIISSDTEGEGGKHTNWLNMMYPRLRLARNLLTDDGVIFISIDDKEVENLKKICDEIYGEENFIGEIIRKTKSMTGDNGNGFNLQHEDLVIYATNKSKVYLFGKEKEFENYSNLDNDPLGEWCSGDPSAKSGGNTTYFPIKNPFTNRVDYPPQGRYWAFSESTLEKYINKGKIKFKTNYKENERGFIFKRYKSEAMNRYNPVNSLFAIENQFMNQSATIELKEVFKDTIFSYPKPTSFLYELVKSCATNRSGIILDFFSGSSTTAHAVMQLNAEDNGNRKFIMVQLPEETDEKSEAYKAGYKNICEIGKERIRRAGEKIKLELKQKYDDYNQKQKSLLDNKEKAPMNPDDLDIGFKVFKLDSSNLKKWSVDVGEDFYKMSREEQNLILSKKLYFQIDNFVDDRSELDVVYEIMLKYGLDLTYPIETYKFDGKNVYSIGFGGLIICLDEDINTELADKIVELVKELKPSVVRVAVRDSSFKSDSSKTNFKETLKNGVYAYFSSSKDKVNKQNQFKFITI